MIRFWGMTRGVSLKFGVAFWGPMDGEFLGRANARPAAEIIPTAQYEIIGDAIHFGFLAQCKSKGAQILANEGEPDPLCDDAGGRGRGGIRAELEQFIGDYPNHLAW